MKKEIKAENVLFPVSYALIVVVSVLILSIAFAGIVSADNEALETTVLPLASEEKGLIRSELKETYLYSSLQTKLIDEQFFEFRVDIFCL